MHTERESVCVKATGHAEPGLTRARARSSKMCTQLNLARLIYSLFPPTSLIDDAWALTAPAATDSSDGGRSYVARTDSPQSLESQPVGFERIVAGPVTCGLFEWVNARGVIPEAIQCCPS